MKLRVPPATNDRIGVMPDSVRDPVDPCPRCGDPHGDLLFHRFARPPAMGKVLYWTTCPITGEPILAEVI
jgi:hypothetical protein